MLPRHDANGFLPEGMHTTTWAEFVERFGNTPRRAAILSRLRVALLHLAQAGCRAVLIGGSFVTTKTRPMDVDVVWSIAGVDFAQLHPIFQGPDGIRDIKAIFGADMFPSFLNEAATRRAFPEFFQYARDGRRVGVVLIDLRTIEKG